MSKDAKAVLAAALALPDVDRAMIVDRLLDSLTDIDGMSDEELEAELDRRADEYTRDPSVATPWSEFRWNDPV
jgi:putative addiction module component (TIGR02574 family)